MNQQSLVIVLTYCPDLLAVLVILIHSFIIFFFIISQKCSNSSPLFHYFSEGLARCKICIHEFCTAFHINGHSRHLPRCLIKRPQSNNKQDLIAPPFSLSRLSLLMIFHAAPLGPWSPAGSAQQQIDISGIGIYCSGPRNHFHFTLCCTGKIRHLRSPANQMSFNRTLSLTFTTVYPTNFS